MDCSEHHSAEHKGAFTIPDSTEAHSHCMEHFLIATHFEKSLKNEEYKNLVFLQPLWKQRTATLGHYRLFTLGFTPCCFKGLCHTYQQFSGAHTDTVNLTYTGCSWNSQTSWWIPGVCQKSFSTPTSAFPCLVVTLQSDLLRVLRHCATWFLGCLLSSDTAWSEAYTALIIKLHQGQLSNAWPAFPASL